MSQATAESVVAAEQQAVNVHGGDPKGRMITRTVVIIGFVLVAALIFALIFSAPVEDPARITIGFSLNSFLVWMGGLHPLVQIPIVLAAFGVVVVIILVLIEYAPRSGRRYFVMRLVACLLVPALAFLLLRPYSNAVFYVVAISLLVGALLFFADYRSRQARGICSS
ncbi:hypothetical protein [Microbacterium sp. CH12i]|uniref:hypothetical protein n=1 Tax=Microbacterium sp. CH12i TaxID=1479651 RepID=UPI001F460090|nr:hypothetical protein [Microbacterium sp. CH12i]